MKFNSTTEMHDIASQLVMKWARHGSEYKIEVTDDFTRLTLDTIALCSMNYRFNSFYHEELHPFISTMGDFLVESGMRPNRLAVQSLFMRAANRKFEADIAFMKHVSEEIVDRGRANPSGKKDLLNAMLTGKDPITGESMSNESIVNNMITFLIAGMLFLSRIECDFGHCSLWLLYRPRDNIWSIIICFIRPVEK